MKTFVFQSSTQGITEYSAAYTGLSGNFESGATGIYAVAGTTDNGAPIVSSFSLGVGSDGNRLLRTPDRAYVQADSEAVMHCVVTTSRDSFDYDETFRLNRMRRFIFGRGIRDSYLGFTFSNPDGAPFLIDSVEINDYASRQRKV